MILPIDLTFLGKDLLVLNISAIEEIKSALLLYRMLLAVFYFLPEICLCIGL